MVPQRLEALDSLRGVAIAAMVIMNLAAVVLNGVPPLTLRWVGSLAAAPVFVLLSGFLVGATAPRHGLAYFLVKRGLWVLAVGVFVDLTVWRIYPFFGVEVLYLIGVSIPLAYLSLKLGAWLRLGLVLALVGFAPLLRHLLGYSAFPVEFYLWGQQVTPLLAPPKLGPVQHWLVDGWFPLFPWLAFAVLGAHLGDRFHAASPAQFQRKLLALGLALTAAGTLAYVFFPPAVFVRGIWSELFYPPTVQYTVLALGVSIALLGVFLYLGDSRLAAARFQPLTALGQASLGLYFLHLALAVYLGLRFPGGWSQLSLWQFGLAYLAMMLCLLAVAEAYWLARQAWPRLLSVGVRVAVLGTIATAAAVLALGHLLPDTSFATGLDQVLRTYW